MWCNFGSKCSLFLSSILWLNISYILMFFEEIHWMPMSQQPIWLTALKETRTLASLHIFLESNYKLVPSLKKFEIKYSVHHFFVGHPEFQYYKVQCGSEHSISISHQNSIAKTPFTHFISLKRLVFFFSLLAELTLLLCHFLSIYNLPSYL